ncbi:MAG TPA: PfkB family carbohydrate kinase [Gaiellaceae bacterium]|nr:PfkB family carbohydrate kinase [Gaiellaceae bacterium]
MNVAVVGHVEWVEFVRVEHVPSSGEIVHALETWDEAAGGGAVAAVQLANLNGGAHLFTSLSDDELGRRAYEELVARGVTVHATAAGEPQRRAYTYVDEGGERTITVLGRKLLPSGEDGSLPWEELARCDAVYFVSGDVAAVRAARRARVLVATARELGTLRRAREQLDVLVGSGEDPGERFEPGELEPVPHTVVTTSGGLGGWIRPGGPFRAAPLPGPVEDAYGCGDCFAAGLTFGLADGLEMDEAVALGARCGAAVLTGRGAYAGQLVVAGPSGPPTRFDQSS